VALAQKLIRGSAVNLAEQGIKLAVVFVTTPLMVRYLGRDDYGLWIVGLAIIGYFRLLDLGVSLSGNRFLSQAIGSGKPERYRELFLTLSYLYNRIGVAALVFTLILSFFVPIWLPKESVITETRWIILGLGLSTAIRFWTQIFEVVLKSHLRYDLIGIASILKALLQGGLIIFFLTSGHGLETLLLIFVATDVLDQLLLFGFSRRIYPEGRVRLVKSPPADVRPLLRYSATAMVNSVAGNLRSGIDPLIIGHISGLALVPVYSIGSRFLSIFSDVINAIFGGNFLAAFSQLDGRNDGESLVRNFLKSVRFSSAIAVTGGSFLVIFGPDFIERWIGPSFADSGLVLTILAAPTVLMLMQYPVGGFFYSQNKQNWLAIITLGGGLFNLILSITLALRIGFFGAVWATCIELSLLFGIFVPYLAARLSNLTLTAYLYRLIKYIAPYLVLSISYALISRTLLEPDYTRLAILGGGLTVLTLPVIWFFTFSAEDRQHVKASFWRKVKTNPRS
jgi:O-antigen/teichoic acid export membrane protein